MTPRASPSSWGLAAQSWLPGAVGVAAWSWVVGWLGVGFVVGRRCWWLLWGCVPGGGAVGRGASAAWSGGWLACWLAVGSCGQVGSSRRLLPRLPGSRSG